MGTISTRNTNQQTTSVVEKNKGAKKNPIQPSNQTIPKIRKI
jgi:hypothetical protein